MQPFISEEGVEYSMHATPYGVGIRAELNGKVEYLTLVPSSSTDDGIHNVFLYQGPAGSPLEDPPAHHYVVLEGA